MKLVILAAIKKPEASFWDELITSSQSAAFATEFTVTTQHSDSMFALASQSRKKRRKNVWMTDPSHISRDRCILKINKHLEN